MCGRVSVCECVRVIERVCERVWECECDSVRV